jgi:hypothetical protein
MQGLYQIIGRGKTFGRVKALKQEVEANISWIFIEL